MTGRHNAGICLFMLLNLAVTAVLGSYPVATEVNEKIPRVLGATAFTIDNVMYAYGGEYRANEPSNYFSAFSFDATTGDLNYKALNEYGPHVAHAEIALMPDNASFTLFGGYYQDTLFDQAPMHAYHYTFENDTWSPLAVTLQPDDNTTIPRARQNFKAIMASDGLVYIFGGLKGPYDPRPRHDFWSYDPSTGAFTQRPYPGFTMDSYTATALPDGRIVYLTGRYFVPPATGFPTPSDMAVIYHTNDGTWENVTIGTTHSTGPARPTTYATAILGPEKRYIYLFGGDDFFAAYNRTYYNNLYVLDTQTWTWYEPEIQGTAPMRRSYATGALITNEYMVFAFGGINTEYTSNMDVLKLPTPNSNGDLDFSSGKWVTNVVTDEIEDMNASPEGLKGGIIAAIVVVVVIAVLIMAAILYRFRHRAKRLIMRIHYDIWNPRTGEPLWAETLRLVSKVLLLFLFVAFFVFVLLQVLRSPKATFTITTMAPGGLVAIPDIRFCFEGFPIMVREDTQRPYRTYPLVSCDTDAGVTCIDNIEPLDLSIHSPYFVNDLGNLTCYLFRPGDMKLAPESIPQANNGTRLHFQFYVLGDGVATGRTHVTVYPPRRDPNAYVYFGDRSQILSEQDVKQWIEQDRNDFESQTVIDFAPLDRSFVEYQLVNQEFLQDVGWNYVGFSPVLNMTPSITVTERTQSQDPANQQPNLNQGVINEMYIKSATPTTLVEREQKIFSLLNALGFLGGLFGLFIAFQTLVFGYRARSPFGLIHRWSFGSMRRSISDGLKDRFSINSSTTAVPLVTPVHQRYSLDLRNYGPAPYYDDNKSVLNDMGSTHTSDSSSNPMPQQQHYHPTAAGAVFASDESRRLANVEDRMQLMELLFKSYYVDDEVFRTLDLALKQREDQQQQQQQQNQARNSRRNFAQFIRGNSASGAQQEGKNVNNGQRLSEDRGLRRYSTSSSLSSAPNPFQTIEMAQPVAAHEEQHHQPPRDTTTTDNNKVD